MAYITANGTGFSGDIDIFNRKGYADMLTRIVSSPKPTVIGLDASWGMGKTTFVKMWAEELEKIHQPVIYFDAFACDYISSPFAAIAGEIIKKTNTLDNSSEAFKKEIVDNAVNTAMIIARSAALSMPVVAFHSGDTQHTAGGGTDLFHDVIAGREADTAAIQRFKNSLSRLPTQFKDNTVRKPLVIIIDELDRCRPTFALGLLEAVKHFLYTDNVHFLLVATFNQMESIVRRQYGVDIDAGQYMHKFYDFLISLPMPEGGTRAYLASKFNIQDDHMNRYARFLLDAVTDRINLRTIDHVMAHISNSAWHGGLAGISDESIMCGIALVIIKYHDVNLFKRIKEGRPVNVADIDWLNLTDEQSRTVANIPKRLRNDKDFRQIMNIVDALRT